MYRIDEILKKAEKTHELKKEEIISLLDIKEDSEEQHKLFQTADRVREKYVGNEVHLRGLIEFSNYCKRNCNYCGLRAENKNIARYRIPEDEIIEIVKNAANLGYKTVVMQSGEDVYYTKDKIVSIVKEIKNKFDLAVTLCVGERPFDEFDAFIKAGVDRYLLRIETTNIDLFNKLHPDDDFNKRLEIIKYLKTKDLQVGTGVMINLPGQTNEMLAEDILLYKEVDIDMVGQGPFLSNPNTPMAECENGDVFTTLKMIAITRILNPDIHIPATTALTTLSINDARQKAFNCGANVVMPNVTPRKYRALYEIYPDKACVGEDSQDCRKCIGGIIASAGRVVSTGYGHRKK